MSSTGLKPVAPEGQEYWQHRVPASPGRRTEPSQSNLERAGRRRLLSRALAGQLLGQGGREGPQAAFQK